MESDQSNEAAASTGTETLLRDAIQATGSFRRPCGRYPTRHAFGVRGTIGRSTARFVTTRWEVNLMPRRGEYLLLTERILRHVEMIPECGCWIWMGQLSRYGYGEIGIGRLTKKAHIIAYREFSGPVPNGLELDHLCRVRSCVNPRHLEPVSHQENIRRAGNCKPAYTASLRSRAEMTACRAGHTYSSKIPTP